jgi:uncharacterized iron-regulated membrane protein
MKAYFLRFHRWITLAFAIPLAVVIVSGLVLSVEPILYDRAVTGRSISLAQVEAALAKHDPEKKANTLNVRAYENVVVALEGRGGNAKRIDLTTGELVAPTKTLWSDTFGTTRRLHQELLIEQRWIVDYATIAMLISMVLGLLMGWPHFRNSLGGWHRGTAWILSPLLFLSPLTGLAIAYGITFTPPPAKVDGPPVPLTEAIKIVAAKHNLADVMWIRPQGGATRVRVYEGGQVRVMAVTRQGLVGGPQSWPRVLHEGTWAGLWSGLLNVIVSIALIGLMGTGLTIWARRNLRHRASRAAAKVPAQTAASR